MAETSPTMTNKKSFDEKLLDISLPTILSPTSANAKPFRETHIAKRGCRKLLDQTSKAKVYELEHTLTQQKLH